MKTLLTLSSLILTLTLGTLAQAKIGPNMTCHIQTVNGRFLTAVGGGGRIDDVIHSDATQAKTWERFTLIAPASGAANVYGLKTLSGNYLTAVDGGGRITNVIHSDATKLNDWEEFKITSVGGGYYSIETFTKNYLTAVGGGGRITDVIHSDAKKVSDWEKFRFRCK